MSQNETCCFDGVAGLYICGNAADQVLVRDCKGLAWGPLGPGNYIVHAGHGVDGTFGENETVAVKIEQPDFSGIP